MDPFTAVGIVDQVGSLAGTLSSVFKALYDYYQKVKTAPEKSQQLHEELYAISNIARNLSTVVASSANLRVESRDNATISNETVRQFENMLLEIERRIVLPDGLFSVERLKWPFSVNENMEFLGRIERFKTTLNLALTVTQRYIVERSG